MRQPGSQDSFPSASLLRSARGGSLCFFCLVLGILAAALAQASVSSGVLPPFRIDAGLPPEIVVNAEQGLGQCHWLDAEILSSPLVSWAYDSSEGVSGWSSIEPRPGEFHWAPLDTQIAKARSLGARIWLELHTTEGQTPQWARHAGLELVGSRGGTPVPWNTVYHRLLRRAVHAMAARYDNDPTVDAVNLMAGGCYGEMVICAPESDRRAWQKAGYTDETFVESVKQIIDIYLEEDYEWEDGSHSHGFLNTPVVLQLGSGLYGHTSAIIGPVAEYAVSKYGMRVWLKFNGFGGEYDMGWLYEQYSTATKVGYEPAGNSLEFLTSPRLYVQRALDQHASYLCLQEPYFEMADPKWEQARELAARYLGAQSVSLGVDAPDKVLPGQAYKFTTKWVNRGTTPLMRPYREGTKDVPASYDVLLALVQPDTGVPVLEHSVMPTPPTTEWYSAEPVRIEATVTIPDSLPAGQYDLTIALLNPAVAAEDAQRCFYLVNVDSHNGDGTYTVGQVTVLNQPTPPPAVVSTPAPAATTAPSPVEGQNWLGRLLRTLWEWLAALLGLPRKSEGAGALHVAQSWARR